MSAKIEIKADPVDGHLMLVGDPRPYHTGKKTTRNHRKIRLRNFTESKLRICFKSQDNRIINQYFDASVTPTADPKIGSVAISAKPATGGPFTEKTVFLLESAFLATKGQLTVSANLFKDEVCDFKAHDEDHVQDIIIDGS